jgi:hypothetical protein
VYLRERVEALGLRFEEDAALIEDILFNVAYIRDISTLNVLDGTPYHYAKHPGAGLTGAFVPDYFELHERRIRALMGLQEEWGLYDDATKRLLGALYGRYVLSALARNCDSRARMTHSDRIAWCKGLFESGLFAKLIPGAAADSVLLGACLAVLRRKSVTACLVLGRLIHMLQTASTSLYDRARKGR